MFLMKTKEKKPSLMKRILWMLFPRHLKCVCCGRDLPEIKEYAFCERCLNELPLANGNICSRCGVNLGATGSLCLGCKSNKSEFARARAPFRYVGALPKLVRGFKYDNKQYLSTVLGRYMLDVLLVEGWQADIVMPVPLFAGRKKQRGYNQAELLAEYIADKTKVNLSIDNLTRTKDTPTQVKLSYKQRAENLKGAFSLTDKTEIKGKTILLIDDVITTTATINECAYVLMRAGARQVFALSAARAEQKVPMVSNAVL